ncbi:hypothetical protein GCM10025789_03180 [Tessaracoccus lubricantis]|uniref:Transcription regulator PadR N-terminal domain-containing protein n=1 Tax=Tessaracoccus lubricantis TaxID=545543 RepID=A0ABP9F7Q3_9ACTN
MLSNVVLGMLMALGPQTLYSLRRAFERSAAMLYTGSPGSLQHALRALTDAGLVEVAAVTEGGRNKKVHTVTPAGVAAFHAWIRTPVDDGDLELGVLTRIFHLGLVEDSAERVQILRGLAAAVERGLAELEAVAESVATVPGAGTDLHRYQVATLHYGVAAHRTALDYVSRLAAAEAQRP